MTPAHWAALKGHDTCLQLLLNKVRHSVMDGAANDVQANVNLLHCVVTNGARTTLQVVLDKYRASEARLLLAQKDKQGETSRESLGGGNTILYLDRPFK